MEHVGIDLGSRKSQVCTRKVNGRYVERASLTAELPVLMRQWPQSRVVMESCAESHAIAEAARAAGHEVVVVPSSLVRELGVGWRKMKTDERDARVLCMAALRLEGDELPSVHLKCERSRQWLDLVMTRGHLVQARTAAVNAIKGRLRRELDVQDTRFSSQFTSKVRERLTSKPSGLDMSMSVLLDTVDSHSEQIERLEKEMKSIAQPSSESRSEMSKEAAHNAELLRRARTMPGIGVLTAMALLATIDEPKRFASPAKLGNYLGLTPGQDTTGFDPKMLGITKAGPSHVRWLLIQCAWSMMRARPNDPIVRWAKKISERSNPRIAAVALARKIACVQWAMWRTETDYDPSMVGRGESEASADATSAPPSSSQQAREKPEPEAPSARGSKRASARTQKTSTRKSRTADAGAKSAGTRTRKAASATN